MIQVISNGVVVAVCDKARYVRVKPSTGAFIQCDKELADGIAVNGQVYSLNDKLDSLPKAEIKEVDGGEFIFSHDAQLKSNAQSILDIETALCELDLEAE